MRSLVTMESRKRYVLLVVLFCFVRNISTSVTHYSIPEEMKEGSVVANLATDLNAIHLDISEATPKGERFSLSNAVDPDIGSNSVKTYHLSESEHFDIEVQTGRDGSKFADLILTKTLDREERAVHNLILTAVDGGTPARSGTASVIVHVLDTNDNAPVFDKTMYNFKIMENSPIGSLVIHLNATDLDEGSNSEITYSYSLYTSEKTQETFNLNPSTGEITVRGMLNYEDFRIYDMEVIATDHGANSLSGQCTIKILVEDMNDNHPEISIKSFQSPVNENIELDTVIAVVSVSDKDSGDNGVVDLHIPDNMPFKLRESSDNYYELVVSEPLDREKVPEYDITFTVTDRGSPPLSDNETMTLELLDVNDNVPQFPQSFSTIRVMENNAPGALLSSLTAFDPDLHENQYLVYFILEKEIANTSMSMLFSINPENGNLYALKTFDYEIEKEFLFHIEARDSGSPPLSSNVTLLDVNDNVPQFPQSFSTIRVMENNAPGALLSSLTAFDPDLHENQYLVYFILEKEIANTSMSMLFSINPENGNLYALKTFDYEIEKEFLFHIEARDSGSPPLSSNVTVHIIIVDQNDNAPVIVSPWRAHGSVVEEKIPRSTDKGSLVAKVIALDTDSVHNSRITYQFLQVTDATLFSLDQYNGEIRTMRMFNGSKFADLILTKTLDREQQAVHNLILTAVDGGTPARSGTASVIVRVLDTNDNAPVFKKTMYNVKIMENSPIGSLVIHLNATDLDEGSNSEIKYSYSLYTSEKTQDTFNLNPSTGEITVKGMLNYEDFRIYDMEVIATDHGANSLSGQCTIKILVEDMNDNHPEISIKSFQSPVNENIELDTVIAVVSVSDKDSGDNGVVDLHIPDNMPFKLRESSDNYYELVVSEPLDREKVPEYDITFTVTDRGSPPLSDNETMTLELLDVNDNVPQFPQSFSTIRVMENNAPGALLSSLTAFDPDLHENQYLVYFILEKEIANTSMSMLFSINPENGNLYALKTFDYEIEKEFLFHIEARDSGSPPLSSNVTVHIIIVDQNDNAPVIVSPWRAHGSVVEEKIPRSTDKGSLVAKVIALDTDSVHNSRITYQFLQVTDATLFSLDQYNGEIRTMRMFSYRDPRHQRLVVVAKDNGEPALSATVTIKLSTVETAVKAYSDMTEVPLEYDIFSDLNLYLVIGLGSVSFLLLITILVTIVLKCQKPKPSKAAPPCRNSVISERNSTIADSTLVSNDAYWYSLFLAETRKGKLVVRQPVPKGSRYIVSSIPRGTGLTDTSDSAASTLQVGIHYTYLFLLFLLLKKSHNFFLDYVAEIFINKAPSLTSHGMSLIYFLGNNTQFKLALIKIHKNLN
uniref:Cadherin domain-containing protein n=1 Tax=Seriola dumerili TaxID=41447 RepID=A0A3B4U6W7_SERDU